MEGAAALVTQRAPRVTRIFVTVCFRTSQTFPKLEPFILLLGSDWTWDPAAQEQLKG